MSDAEAHPLLGEFYTGHVRDLFSIAAKRQDTDWRMAVSRRNSGIHTFAEKVILKSSGPAEVARACEEFGIRAELARWLDGLETIRARVNAGDKTATSQVPPWGAQAAAFYLMWFLGEADLVRRYLERALEQNKLSAETNDTCPFIYGTGIPEETDAIWAFINGEHVPAPTDMSVFNPEDFYTLPDIELMRAIVAREDLAPALDAVADAFKRENRDMKLDPDGYRPVNGCGRRPLGWNVRLYTILQHAVGTFDHLKGTPLSSFDAYIFPSAKPRAVDGVNARDVKIVFGFRDSKKLKDALWDLGYDCEDCDEGLSSQKESQAVWIGGGLSLGVLKETLAPLLRAYGRLRYFQLRGEGGPEVAYRAQGEPYGALPDGSLELFVGGETESARDLHQITPTEPADVLKALEAASTLEDFHAFVRRLSSPSMHPVR